MTRLTRRFVLGGVLAGVSARALANAPSSAPRPMPRPVAGALATSAPVAPEAAGLIEAAGLGGAIGFAVADVRSGAILEAWQGDAAMPPASTVKAITSLYALERLGPAYRFATRLVANGPVVGGRIEGDLILAGGGDPTLSTDTLGDMAAALRRAGITGVTGRFLVWGGALPYLRAIDQSQPDYLGYNPAISGLNLNFNRVYFEWKAAGGGDYSLSMDARAERFVPKVYMARVSIAEREVPVFTYSDRGALEEWTVARPALGDGGGRWLPVRRPELYAGDVFQTLARAEGLTLPAPKIALRPSAGTVLVETTSEPLAVILRDMMKYSTNMTAEAVGMAASAQAGIDSHLGSARAMTDWLHARGVSGRAEFTDHSGLGGASRMTAQAMVAALVSPGGSAGLRGLMKPVALKGEAGRIPGLRIEAKTGTLNFVSALAGYMTTEGGRELAFAIFSGDVARRDAVPDAQKENPQGGSAWLKRARALQQQLLVRWCAVHAG